MITIREARIIGIPCFSHISRIKSFPQSLYHSNAKFLYYSSNSKKPMASSDIALHNNTYHPKRQLHTAFHSYQQFFNNYTNIEARLHLARSLCYDAQAKDPRRSLIACQYLKAYHRNMPRTATKDIVSSLMELRVSYNMKLERSHWQFSVRQRELLR